MTKSIVLGLVALAAIGAAWNSHGGAAFGFGVIAFVAILGAAG